MNDGRWSRVEEVFHHAADLPHLERAGYLNRVCNGDVELRRQVELLLANDETGDDLLGAVIARAVDRLSDSAHEIAPGTSLGPYEIVTLIGRGGMGEVYRARDPRLDRDVAVKVVPEHFSDRFQQEARAIAALNHPNICQVYDIGPNFLVMELVEGPTLADRLRQSSIPLDESVSIIRQIGGALEAAHGKRIVHRDLKPANIKIAPGSQVKVLDFGLAKPAGPLREAADVKEIGLVVGTPGYMSPEQASGDHVDQRSDVWSYGCVLYEMLTGRPAFAHTAGPNWSLLPLETPAAVQEVVRRCLAKDPDSRYQTIAEAKLAIEESVVHARAARQHRWTWALSAAGLLLFGGGAFALLHRIQTPARYPLRQITFEANVARDPALSPDGKLLAYASDRDGENHFEIWIKQLTGGEPFRLTTGAGSKSNPQFSSDGAAVYYLSQGDLFKISASGGIARKVFERAGPFSVSSRGEIAFYRPGTGLSPSQISIVSGDGAAEIWHPECVSLGPPAWSADGGRIAFAGECETSAKPAIMIAPRKNGAIQIVAPASLDQLASRLTWFRLRNGREGLLLSYRSGDSKNLFRLGLDGSQRQVTFGTGAETAGVVSLNGDVIFTRSETTTGIWSIPLAESGAKPAKETAPGSSFAVSKDGTKLVYGRMLGAFSGELVLRDLRTRTETVLATHDVLLGGFGSLWPQISPDGKSVIYRIVTESSNPSAARIGAGILQLDAANVNHLLSLDGGAPRSLATAQFALASEWRGDSKRVIGECTVFSGGVCELDLAGGKVRQVLDNPAGEQLLYPSLSWDGKWAAFMERRAGRTVITVTQALADGTLAGQEHWIRITSDQANASRPRFSPDGSSVYYLLNAPSNQGEGSWTGETAGQALVRQKLNPISMLPLGEPTPVIRVPFSGLGIALIDLSRDRLFFNTSEVRSNLWLSHVD